MKQLAKEFVIVAAKRTPFGAYGGSLEASSATESRVPAARAALEDGGVAPDDVDALIFGDVLQSSQGAICNTL